MTQIPLEPHEFWTIVAIGLIAFVAFPVLHLGSGSQRQPLKWREKLGLQDWPWFAFTIGATLWLTLLLLLFGGLVFSVVRLVSYAIPDSQNYFEKWDFNFFLAGLAALTATTGAVIAVPFTFIRIRIAGEANLTAEQGLITDRINNAVEGLGAEKTVYRLGRDLSMSLKETSTDTPPDKWGFEFFDEPKYDPNKYELNPEETSGWTSFQQQVPNLEVRIGAIYSLERIAQDSPRDHIQIMEILCAYIKENSQASQAATFPENADYIFRSQEWTQCPPIRTDIQVALDVIGRRSEELYEQEREAGYRLDLPNCNFQNARFRNNWRSANFDGSVFEQADLRGSDFSDASLRHCQMSKCTFVDANFYYADLFNAKFKHTQFNPRGKRPLGVLMSPKGLGVELESCLVEETIFIPQQSAITAKKTTFEACKFSDEYLLQGLLNKFAYGGPGNLLQKCAFRNVNLEKVSKSFNLGDFFGDASVEVNEPPAHWAIGVLSDQDFETEWNEWRITLSKAKGSA